MRERRALIGGRKGKEVIRNDDRFFPKKRRRVATGLVCVGVD